MKTRFKSIALIVSSALMLSSCAVYDYPVYTSASVGVGGHGWSTSVSWSNARYDVNGFPIYGYYYGQPVYGYTAAGAAIFSIAAITAACLVPDWGPAPWYCGHWHYPRHVRRVARPQHCPAGHYPGRKAPHTVHRAPSHHHHPGVHHKPSHSKPAIHHKPGVNHRPGAVNKPGASSRPSVSRPSVSRPQVSRPSVSRPQRPTSHARPSAGRPSFSSRPQMHRPQVSRPSGGRTHSRPSRPSGHSRGHSGGHRR